MGPQMTIDETIKQMREQISALDRELVELVNRRLELVAGVRARKEELGIEFVDPAREAEMLELLQKANRGPLTRESLAELHRTIVAIGKRQIYGR
jgi:chorismate mutase